MYQVADSEVIARGGRALLRRRAATHVSRTVILLGLVSMLTDISSEMVNTILPIYLVFTLGMTPLQFGVIDGIQQGAAALVRVAQRLHRGPARPLQGGRRLRLRPVGVLPDRLPGRRPLVDADRRRRLPRPTSARASAPRRATR